MASEETNIKLSASVPSITMTTPEGISTDSSCHDSAVDITASKQSKQTIDDVRPGGKDATDVPAATDNPDENSLLPPRPTRRSSRRVRRAASARERERERVRPRIRRSISMQGAADGKQYKPHHRPRRHGSTNNRRSRPSSTVSSSDGTVPSRNGSRNSVKDGEHSNSLVEIVAVELGITNGDGISPKERKRRRIVFAVILTTMIILTASVMLVAITLILSPAVDAALRKENEEIYRVMASIPTTPPPQDVARANHTSTTTGQPG